jgi:hypothetical protein
VSGQSPIEESSCPEIIQWIIAAALICLGLCVVNWGLQYKMSLYNERPNTVSHAPAAKLWMGKDGGSDQFSQVPLPEPTPLLTQVTYFIAVLALYLAVRNATLVATVLSWHRRRHFPATLLTVFREAFFLRPPPVNA